MVVTEHANSRFAVYLIPPYKVARAVAEIHQMLRKQFGFIAADQFQVPILQQFSAIYLTDSTIQWQWWGCF
ncbi:MAG: hypothetical protein H8E47_12005 [Anaerolineales bacterium]|nr:hypothetical protein [Anaerolineales bacterium]